MSCQSQIYVDRQQKIDELFKQWDNKHSPGAAIGIIQNGKLIYTKEYGMANLDYEIPLTVNSQFYIASIAKQFTAACVALLAIDEELSLDEDIRSYFPELPDYGYRISIRNLIHHTSGLRDYLSIMYLSGHSFEDYFNNADGINLIARQKALNYEPNEEYLYSNSNYILLAELVKRVSGMSIREYASQKIFEPLGMKNTFFNDDHTQITSNRVISYRKNEDGSYSRFVQNFDGHGDGGMISTIEDLYLWDLNFYHKKVGGEALAELILSRRKLTNGFLSGYSFGIEHGNYKGLKINMHGGNFLGFNHHFTRFPDQNFSVIILANTNEIDPYFFTDRISDIFLSDLYEIPKMVNNESSEKVVTSFKLSQEELNRFKGHYWSFDGNFSRNIYVSNDTLRFDRGMNNISSLVPISHNEFKMLVGDNVKVKFETEDVAKESMTVIINDTDFFNFEKYVPSNYKIEELKAFCGSYFSPELNCSYVISLQERQLILTINKKAVSKLNPVMKNYFISNFVGSISFDDGNLNDFVINSGRVRGVKFSKQ